MLAEQNASIFSSSEHLNAVYDLGDCIFHAEHGELHSKITHKIVPIEKKVAQVFQCLAQAEGEVVTREAIFSQVWPKVIASDDSLNRCISVLRKTFKKFDHGLAITTHPKVGFNLVYPARCDIECLAKPTMESPNAIAQSLTHFNTKPLIWLMSFVLTITTIWQLSAHFSYKDLKEKQFSDLTHKRVAIMPFDISPDLYSKYINLERKFRQLISNHPNHITLDRSELLPLARNSVKSLNTKLNVGLIVKASISQNKAREILSWQIIDTRTGDELSNQQLDLTINQVDDNAKILATHLITTNAKFRFSKNKQAYINYILTSAKYLYSPTSNQAYQRPVINMLAQTLTEVAPNSVPILVLFAKFITTSQWQDPKRSEPYIRLAINILKKAIALAPQNNESYQALADIYQLRYQWEKAYEILSKIEEPNKSIYLTLQRRTSTISGLLLESVEKRYKNEPTNVSLGKKLVVLYIETQQFTKAISLADSLPISLKNWQEYGAILGPIYLAIGRKDKGEALTITGYLNLGIETQYSQILIQGIRHPKSMKQASEFLKQAQKDNHFSQKILLQMYEQLNDLDSYFELAFGLSKTFQYDVFTSQHFNASHIRKHERFIPLMESIGLIQYWQTIQPPTFCESHIIKICT